MPMGPEGFGLKCGQVLGFTQPVTLQAHLSPLLLKSLTLRAAHELVPSLEAAMPTRLFGSVDLAVVWRLARMHARFLISLVRLHAKANLVVFRRTHSYNASLF